MSTTGAKLTQASPFDADQKRHFLFQMLRIRLFEERTLEMYSKGKLFGTTHTCIGQEADCVGYFSALEPRDVVFSNHRGHGHYLAFGGDMRRLAAELMGRATGVSGGLGGSQHLHFGNFYSNGIQGGIVPCATGMALAEKRRGEGAIVSVFLGDGTLGEGAVYESLNIASLWKLPICFVLENNRYAQSTPIALNLAGDIPTRFRAFGIEPVDLRTTDVLEIAAAAREVVEGVRARQEPAALILETFRFAPHSKGDDTREPAEIASYRQHDPIPRLAVRLPAPDHDKAHEAALREVDEAFRLAESDPWPAALAGQGA
ncbi:MAG: thiamine pyrophosphate-dependent dehydrogenase E1 component subunit alpha [Bryobacteraceae bacterium]